MCSRGVQTGLAARAALWPRRISILGSFGKVSSSLRPQSASSAWPCSTIPHCCRRIVRWGRRLVTRPRRKPNFAKRSQ